MGKKTKVKLQLKREDGSVVAISAKELGYRMQYMIADFMFDYDLDACGIERLEGGHQKLLGLLTTQCILMIAENSYE